MKINNQISVIISSGGSLSDITDGALRLDLATRGIQSLAQNGIQLSQAIDRQFNSFNHPMAVQDLYKDYQNAVTDFNSVALQAGNILKTAQSGGSLNLDQTQTLEKLNEKANKVITKLKQIKQELIRRRLEGDDEFDGRGGAAPMLLISCES